MTSDENLGIQFAGCANPATHHTRAGQGPFSSTTADTLYVIKAVSWRPCQQRPKENVGAWRWGPTGATEWEREEGQVGRPVLGLCSGRHVGPVGSGIGLVGSGISLVGSGIGLPGGSSKSRLYCAYAVSYALGSLFYTEE